MQLGRHPTMPRRSTFVALAVASVVALVLADGALGDWAFLGSVADEMFGGVAMRIYSQRPNAQIGPVGIEAVWFVRHFGGAGLRVVTAVLAIVAMWCLVRLAAPTCRTSCLVLAGLLVLYGWPTLKTSGHLDDALTLTIAAAVTLLAVHGGRRLLTALLVGVTLAVKPWAVFLLPLTLTPGVGPKERRRALLISLAVGAVLWLPFFIAAPSTIEALRPTVRVAKDSVLRLFGVTSSHVPTIVRIVQLLVALGVATWAVKHGRSAGVLLVGVAVRLAVDPGTWDYYTVGFLLGAAIWDVSRDDRRRLPWATLTGSLLLPADWIVRDLGIANRAGSAMRLAACAIALAMVLWPERSSAPAEAPRTRTAAATPPDERTGHAQPATR